MGISLPVLGVPGALGGGGFTGLLDDLGTPAPMFALRRLLASYTGYAVRIRESGGDTEADIGFTATGELDTAYAAAHIGANDGYIVTWYDQSGNSWDVTQADTTKQPLYVASGINSLPTIRFDTNDFLATAGNVDLSSYNKMTLFAVINFAAGATDRILLEHGTDPFSTNGFFLDFTSAELFNIATKSATGGNFANWQSTAATSGADIAASAVINMSLSSGEVTGWVNGSSAGTNAFDGDNTGNWGSQTLYMGARAGASLFFAGDCAEVFGVLDALGTSDRQTVEADQSERYGLGF